MDFLTIALRRKRDVVEVYPQFLIPTYKEIEDLMIRGGDFYAVWDEERNVWSTNERDASRLIDAELDKYVEEHRQALSLGNYVVKYMRYAESGMIDVWHKYCKQQLRDSYHPLDETVIFANTEVKKTDYSSHRLPYSLEEGSTDSWDELMSVLYSPEERHKIEWAIGGIIAGESKNIQKFVVLYGPPGSGKSTVLDIIEQLFEGYTTSFDAQKLGMANSEFALEPFKSNPLVAIQHDGKLNRIEDNTRLNSLISHEKMTVNAKYEKLYTTKFNSFLFLGTNEPVKITNAKSGLLRRLIDVSPTGEKIPLKRYKMLVSKVKFELGAIAWKCRDVFMANPDYYSDYIPTKMLGASNDFYNFVLDCYPMFKREDEVTLIAAWNLYKTYTEEVRDPYPMRRLMFAEELKNYFRNFDERGVTKDGDKVRNLYSGFRFQKFASNRLEERKEAATYMIMFDEQPSVFDKEAASWPAQYANRFDKPSTPWSEVKTKLSDLDTSMVHYVRVPENHIVIDFDLKDDDGNKNLEKNLEAASKWPPTYAELSKSEAAIHLHYIYKGDVSKLAHIYAPDIEIKVFNGNSALRRKLSRCNNLPIATISSGLPLKGEKRVVNFDSIKNERQIRTMIEKNLRKEYWPSTSQSINFIQKILDDAYESGMHYDVSDLYSPVMIFAQNSSNQSDRCLTILTKMHFKSDDISEAQVADDNKLVFYDVEVFPNLFIVCWKVENVDKVHRLINPTPPQIENLIKFNLIGFNCRRYDNHILYARIMGYTNEQLYHLSQKIIEDHKDCFFGEAYNISYTDVYDFAATKQSLKKWEIELKIHHKELGLRWDEPVPEEMWDTVASYCDNDVIATEAVFHHLKGDWTARQILADVAGMTVNDTTNSLTTRIIFGKERKPQSTFNYRNMGDESQVATHVDGFDEYTVFDKNGRPIFPGYVFDHGKSTYRGEETGEGGYVYGEPGVYTNVALLDIASQHPSSIVAEELFGKEYTRRFQDILQTRIAIKHKDFDHARNMLDGKLAKYLDDPSTAKDLAQALKIAINSVYGLTSAKFDNAFRDPRNADNIVAKRGALFMVNLKHEVQKRGFIVAHIKTDSIKIPNATPEIIQFVMDYGKMYGYNFEHEATYDRICLVNDAVYIAKYDNGEWTATGTQFQVPYVFKTLFSHEPIEFGDKCETKSATTALYLDMNEDLQDVSAQEKELKNIESKYKKGLLSDTTYEQLSIPLREEIAMGHNYVFVGRVGSFCPIKPGHGGGLLMREKEGRFSAAGGSKNYRWLEAEYVREMGMEDVIDESYYITQCNDAIDTINKYGDFDRFVSDEPYDTLENYMNKPEGISVDDEVPFD